MWKLLTPIGLFITVLFETASCITIQAPSTYVAFTGKIDVNYINMNLTNPVAELVDASTNRVISQSRLPVGYPNAMYTIQCGGIDYEGTFRVQIIDKNEEKVVAQTDDIVVRWPHIVLQIPSSLETLTGNVKINFELRDKVECNSLASDTAYTIELVMYSNLEDLTQLEVIHKVNMSTFSNLALDSNPITMNCALFDQKGTYELRFFSSQGTGSAIAVSNQMTVEWSDMYAVGTQEDHIFPCDQDFLVTYQQPRCAGADDKIRMYEKKLSTDSVNGPSAFNYKTEHRALRGENTVRFKCDIFRDDILEYCFKYVSFARSGVLHEHDTKCVPTKFSPGIAVDGGWSPWSAWGKCSSTCEGGTRSRHRICNNPPPTFNGKTCSGDTGETETCGSKCAVATTLSPFKTFTTDPECICGCHLAGSRGNIVTSSSVCKGSSIWKINAPEGHAVRLTFLYYNLRKGNDDTRIQIRDGDSLRDTLLFDEYGGHDVPPQIESRQNKMLIEFMSPQQRVSGEYSALDEGFAASYMSFVLTGPGATDSQDSTIWSSTILVIAVLLFLAIVIAVVGFIFYHRYNMRKKKKERLQMANQALLVNGEAPHTTSPSHSQSVSSVKGSTNISFGDPVSSPTHKSGKKRQRDYVLPTTSPGSPTRVRDVKLKHKRPRSPSKGKGAKGGGVGSPPQSPSKHKVGPALPQVYSSPRSAHREVNSQQAKDTTASAGQTPTSVYSISSHGYIPVSTLGSPATNAPRTTAATGSPLATRGDARNKSFLSAISKPAPAPLAGHEELTPTSPKELPPSYSTYFDNSSSGPVPYGKNSVPQQEAIPMDSYYYAKPAKPDTYSDMGRITETAMYSPHTKRRYHHSPREDMLPPEKRPPVEGRDSLTRKKAEHEHTPVYETVQNPSQHQHHHGGGVTRPDIHHSNSAATPQNYHHVAVTPRPEIKPLPLRSIQRPDGQSPDSNNKEGRGGGNNVKTPNSCISSELSSPIFKKDPLFPESKSNSTMDLDLAGDNDFEYDDYVPELPGSYFSMDPHAYTLTWSQQPKWGGAGEGGGVEGNKQQQQQKAAQSTNNSNKNDSSMC